MDCVEALLGLVPKNPALWKKAVVIRCSWEIMSYMIVIDKGMRLLSPRYTCRRRFLSNLPRRSPDDVVTLRIKRIRHNGKAGKAVSIHHQASSLVKS